MDYTLFGAESVVVGGGVAGIVVIGSVVVFPAKRGRIVQYRLGDAQAGWEDGKVEEAAKDLNQQVALHVRARRSFHFDPHAMGGFVVVSMLYDVHEVGRELVLIHSHSLQYVDGQVSYPLQI